MEANKDSAEQCRDRGAEALRNKQYKRSVKLLKMSLGLYPLPGVKALLSQAERKLAEEESNPSASAGSTAHRSTSTSSSSNEGPTRSQSTSSSTNTTSNSTTNESNGRSYTPEQAKIVDEILRSKQQTSSRVKPHYQVLGVPEDATEAQLKKAYRKLAIKIHPDKNPHPKSDEAFKAVGLAYATLSDPEKRQIYDRYGEEDPDQRGGGAAANPFRGAGFRGRGRGRPGEPSPEDIFNMFFNGGMPGGMGGPGFRVYTNGNGFHFNTGHPGMNRQRRQQQQQRQEPQNPMAQLLQFLPIIMIFVLSFLNFDGDQTSSTTTQYFSLVHNPPLHTNPLRTQFTSVKDIPFFVSDKFMRTYARDRYQLAQVERMVEQKYKSYLTKECQSQQIYKQKLEKKARTDERLSEKEKERNLARAKQFQLSRCEELEDLFGITYHAKRR